MTYVKVLVCAVVLLVIVALSVPSRGALRSGR